MVPPQPAAFAGAGSAATAGSAGATLAAQSPYSDVAPTGVHHDAIRALAADGVFVGTDCAAGRFCPDEPLPRWTLAVWLVRVLDGADPDPVAATRFADVSADHPHAAFIERFAQLRVTKGCGDGTRYCPDDPVTRAQTAVFLARAFNLPDGPDPGFSDVTQDAWYAPAVAKLAASGVTKGCGDGTRYCPDDPVTRAQTASFLHRARTLHLELLELNVFYCGPSGEYDDARLRTEVDLLQQHVDGFYRRQSGYDASGGTRGTTITFRVGGILPADILPPGHSWEDQTLQDWHNKSNNRHWDAAQEEDRWKDPCVSAAEAITGDHRSVILVNIKSGPDYTLGYGFPGTTGPAISLTEDRQVSHYRHTQEQFLYYTVAHEIGHAFYDWSHPLEDDQLDQPPTTEQIMSVMSRPTGMYDHSGTVRLDLAPGPNSAYIACYHLAQHNWAELDDDGSCTPIPPKEDEGNDGGAVVDDDPELWDMRGDYSWFKPPPEVDSQGYGDNGFRFTIANGNDTDIAGIDNWARWSFEQVSGRYEVQAWIPALWATAHVGYVVLVDHDGIWEDHPNARSFSADEHHGFAWLDQQQVTSAGWQSLGIYELQGAVRIEIADSQARDDYRDVGIEDARIAADAIRLIPRG